MGNSEHLEAPIALHSTRVLLAGELKPAWIVVKNGKIEACLAQAPEGISVTDFGDKVILPGLIDSHVHINEPGRTAWEGFETATKAAAAGGITTLVDMPLNSSPVTTTLAAFKAKLKAAEGKIHVDCGFYGGIVPGNTADLQPLMDAGVLGIKAFLSHSGIDEFPNVTEADLRAGMPIIAQNGIPLLVHSELVEDHPEIDLPKTAPRSHEAWLRSRPKEWENNAVALMIALCREYQCKTHIVHLSSAEAIPMLESAVAEGLPITIETCPHYLVFAAEDIAEGKTLFKCAPPIREKANNLQLWEGLRSGLITMVVTDHSPSTPELKSIDEGKFSEAWGGIASLQFSLAATWTEAEKLGFEIPQVAAWMSENVAKFLGIDTFKGKIAPGYDADLLIWEPETFCPTAHKDIHHKHPVSPYAEMDLKGRVYQTWLGGKIVYDRGNFPNLGLGNIILRKN